MTGPTITFAAVNMFVDLTRPGTIHIADAGYTLRFGESGDGAHLTLHLTGGSLEALRDAINTHLDSA